MNNDCKQILFIIMVFVINEVTTSEKSLVTALISHAMTGFKENLFFHAKTNGLDWLYVLNTGSAFTGYFHHYNHK